MLRWLFAPMLGGIFCAAGAELDSGPSATQLYRKHCAACHGERGDGRTPVRASLVPPPRDFTGDAARGLTRERMVATVRDGRSGTAMVGWKTRLQPAEIEAVVDFIRAAFMRPGAGGARHSVAFDPGAPMPQNLVGNSRRGGRFFAANCAVCHGIRGDGVAARAQFLTPRPRPLGEPDSRARLNRPALFAAIAAGKSGTDMPAWDKVLTSQEIADVSEYVFQAFVRPAAPRRK